MVTRALIPEVPKTQSQGRVFYRWCTQTPSLWTCMIILSLYNSYSWKNTTNPLFGDYTPLLTLTNILSCCFYSIALKCWTAWLLSATASSVINSFVTVMSLFCTPQIWQKSQTLYITFPMLRGYRRMFFFFFKEEDIKLTLNTHESRVLSTHSHQSL